MTWRAVSIEESNLSTRAKNALLNEGARTAGCVASMTPWRIRTIGNVGRKTATEIIFWLIALCIYEDVGKNWMEWQ